MEDFFIFNKKIFKFIPKNLCMLEKELYEQTYQKKGTYSV